MAIVVKNLIHNYGDRAILKNLSFSIQKGDFFIIIGPNGSGKTTLMKAMSGMLKIQNGHLEVMGRPIKTYSRRALGRTIAFVPQTIQADFPFTTREVVLMGRSPYLGIMGLEQKADHEIARQAMAFTEVESLADRKLDQLSGGERQLVFIARAICQEPQIILLDEPTASLDLAHQVKIMDLMEELKEQRKITMVMVSHDLNLAAMYGDRLLLLKQGKIVKLGTPDNVLTYQTLEETYGCTLLVDQSPLGKFPRISLVPRKALDPGGKAGDHA